ncbi:TonB-dependent receptor [Sphingomonas sp. NFX23]|uniref:TonB-dependent receptor n=1 Tax=Sphingomonas sp. NFX23 TaxID=2819532 RepID=UPI003CE6AD9F
MKLKALLLSSGLSIALYASPTVAQTAPSSDDAAAITQPQATATPEPDTGDIIVTANRTQSLASKTPVALTAISGSDLLTAGISNPTNLGQEVPNLTVNRAAGGLQFTIRGVTSNDQTEKGDPSAAFLLNGIYIARPQAQEVSFFDIARVEVLRGPQGTLYGRNTTAGLINVLTNRPTSRFEGSVDAGVGNYGTYQATAVLNVPVSENLALRGGVNFDRRDSYYKAGTGVTSKLDPYKENISGRLQALYKWNSGDFLIRGDYTHIGGQFLDYVPMSNNYSGINITGVNPIYLNNSSDRARRINAALTQDLGRDTETFGVDAEINQHFGDVNVTYLGSYRKLNLDQGGARFAANLRTYQELSHGRYNQTSHEIRVSDDNLGPLKLQGGGYFFREWTRLAAYVNGFLSPTPGTPGYVYGFPQDPVTSRTLGAFTQGTLSVTDTLRVTGGVRYSNDHKARSGAQVRCGTLACDAPTDVRALNDASRSFSKVTWRGGVDWDLNARSLLYASVATGYKAGGFNDGCTAASAGCATPIPEAALYYEPETLTSYEIGLKTRFLDNAVRLNLSAFHYDYNNLQLSQTSTICGGPCTVTTNAAKAKIDGVEAEGVLVLSPRNRVDLSATYLDARYSRFAPRPGVDWSGFSLDRSPRWTTSMGYTYTLPLTNGAEVKANVRTQLSDRYVISGISNLTLIRQPSYTRTDASITYSAAGSSWYVQGFVKNLENAVVLTNAVVGTFPSITLADPRTFGGRVGFRF